MNKQEAINQIKLLKARETFMSETIWVKQDDVIEIISQIHEPQKVAIPKFVAEWIVEAEKIHNNLSWVWFSNPVSDELNAWLKDHTETFMRAWLEGYEVEKEKLYTVEIPNPNGVVVCLERYDRGKIALPTLGESELTEAEIKEDFEWAWQWAKEVE